MAHLQTGGGGGFGGFLGDGEVTPPGSWGWTNGTMRFPSTEADEALAQQDAELSFFQGPQGRAGWIKARLEMDCLRSRAGLGRGVSSGATLHRCDGQHHAVSCTALEVPTQGKTE